MVSKAGFKGRHFISMSNNRRAHLDFILDAVSQT